MRITEPGFRVGSCRCPAGGWYMRQQHSSSLFFLGLESPSGSRPCLSVAEKPQEGATCPAARIGDVWSACEQAQINQRGNLCTQVFSRGHSHSSNLFPRRTVQPSPHFPTRHIKHAQKTGRCSYVCVCVCVCV